MLEKAVSLLNAIGSVWVLGLMLLINTDVLGRFLLNAPVTGVPELVSFSIVGIVFLQLAHTLRAGALTRSDVLLNALKRRPHLRAALLMAFHATGAVLLAVVAWYLWPSLTKSSDNPARNFIGNPGFFTLPKWPLYAVMMIGIVATCLQFTALALGDIHRTIRGSAQ